MSFLTSYGLLKMLTRDSFMELSQALDLVGVPRPASSDPVPEPDPGCEAKAGCALPPLSKMPKQASPPEQTHGVSPIREKAGREIGTGKELRNSAECRLRFLVLLHI